MKICTNDSHSKGLDPFQKAPATRLTSGEKRLLTEYEDVISKGLNTFFEVGTSLIAIRNARLYREPYDTFEAYCQARWGFGRTYAWRVMGAAERLSLLPSGDETRRPTSEFQMRPFLKLKPEDFPAAWKNVVEKMKDTPITCRAIRDVVNDTERSGTRNRQKRTKKLVVAESSVAQVLITLHQAKGHVAAHRVDEALQALERVEQLLFFRPTEIK